MKKVIILGVIIGFAVFTLSSQELGVQPGRNVVADNLDGPMGLYVEGDGTVWVIESGTGGDQEFPFVNPETGEPVTARMGHTARVMRIGTDGNREVYTTLPSINVGQEVIGGAKLTMLNGVLYATVGQWLGAVKGERPELQASVVRIDKGIALEVANTWDYERTNNPGGFALDTHPFGIAATPDGNLLVADAGGNALYRVMPDSGNIELVASFEGLPSSMENPARKGAKEADPVPTGVAVSPDGKILVSFLSGFPFSEGSAKVVEVSSGGQISDYASGLTTLTDLKYGPDGELYAIQFGRFADQGWQPDSGALVRIGSDGSSEVVERNLRFPTAVGFDDQGNAYVSVGGVGAPGSGAVVRFPGVAAR